jgi:hypothetical protein
MADRFQIYAGKPYAMRSVLKPLQDLHRDITTTASDIALLARIDAAVKAFTGRAARWTDHVTAADVRALGRQFEAMQQEQSR